MDSRYKLKRLGVSFLNIACTHVKSFIDSPMATETAMCIVVRLIIAQTLTPCIYNEDTPSVATYSIPDVIRQYF